MSYRLCDVLKSNKILYEYQFGFRKHQSTVVAVMEVVDNTCTCHHLDKHEFVIGIYLGLQ